MRLRGIFRFESGIQLRSPATWFIALLLGIIAFLFVRSNYLADALYAEFYLNAPFVIASTTVFCTLFWFILAAPIAGRAGARDPEDGIDPIVYTTPVGVNAYLGGRFLAAIALNLLVLTAVPLGIFLAIHAPGVDPELIGPFRPAAWLTPFLYFTLPSAFIGTAIQFSFAVLGRRALASYVGSVLLLFIAYGGMIVLALFAGEDDLALLLDLFGHIYVTSDLILGWTTIEKNTRLVGLDTHLLQSRLFWIGVALAALLLTRLRFRFVHHTTTPWIDRLLRRGRTVDTTEAGKRLLHPLSSVLQGRPRFDFGSRIRQLARLTWWSFRSLATSITGVPLLLGLALLTVLILPQTLQMMGTPLLPRTELLLGHLTAPLTSTMTPWIIIPLLIIFWSGELVRREESVGLGEISDALPLPDALLILARFLALGLLVTVWMGLLMLVGLGVQVGTGYTDVELGLWTTGLFGLQLPEYLLFVILALAIQEVVGRKYVGHMAALLLLGTILFAPRLGIEHPMLVYGTTPAWSYTDMRGFGGSLGPWGLFMAWWGAWGLLLGVAAALLRRRGRDTGMAARMRRARERLRRGSILVGTVATALIITFGSWILAGTSLGSGHRTTEEIAEIRAGYERSYRRYADSPQPRITSARLRVEIFPASGTDEISGSYRLVNETEDEIDTIHVATVPSVATEEMTLDRPTRSAIIDDEHGHRIYILSDPLEPGDSLRLDFTVARRSRPLDGGAVTARSTYFRGGDRLPDIGYQSDRELMKPGERREHGLSARPLLPRLADVESAQDITGEEGHVMSGADPVTVETIIGTSEDQVAIAPGRLLRSWRKGDRRYFAYATDGPIGSDHSFVSARFEVYEETWVDGSGDSSRNVPIEIYYYPTHDAHVERMLRSVRESLSYYSEAYGPYPYEYLRLIEKPGTGVGAHAEPETIEYSEGFGRFDPTVDSLRLDLPFAVIAHEMAHQWGVPYAFAEGAALLSESFAWYAAMGVVERANGTDELHRLLRFFRGPVPIPPIRQSLPLLRASDPYAAYRKGPFALHGLSRYIGRDRVDLAFRRLIDTHRRSAPPVPATTLDLYRELRRVTPDTLRPLLHDLFAANTLWDLETEEITAVETENGRWRVRMEIRARKIVVDTTGSETEVPLDAWIEIGLFAPTGPGPEYGERIYLKKHRIRSGRQTIEIEVGRRPADGGVDPYHLLIEEERGDNVEKVGSS